MRLKKLCNNCLGRYIIVMSKKMQMTFIILHSNCLECCLLRRLGSFLFSLSRCKIAEAQITKIDCENILGLWKIFKLTIGMKKINPKENKHKTPRFMWFGNSLYSRGTMNKFHYNKFGIIQIGIEKLSQTQIPNTPK